MSLPVTYNRNCWKRESEATKNREHQEKLRYLDLNNTLEPQRLEYEYEF